MAADALRIARAAADVLTADVGGLDQGQVNDARAHGGAVEVLQAAIDEGVRAGLDDGAVIQPARDRLKALTDALATADLRLRVAAANVLTADVAVLNQGQVDGARLPGGAVATLEAAITAGEVAHLDDVGIIQPAKARLKALTDALAAADLRLRGDELETAQTTAAGLHAVDPTILDNVNAAGITNASGVHTDLKERILAAEVVGLEIEAAKVEMNALAAAISKTSANHIDRQAKEGFGIHSAQEALSEWEAANDALQAAMVARQTAELAAVAAIDTPALKQARENIQKTKEKAEHAAFTAKQAVENISWRNFTFTSREPKENGFALILEHKKYIESQRPVSMQIIYDINIATAKLKKTLEDIQKKEIEINGLPDGSPEEKRKKVKARQELAELGQGAWEQARKIESLEARRLKLQKEVEREGKKVTEKHAALGVAPAGENAKQQAMIEAQTKLFVDAVTVGDNTLKQVAAWNAQLQATPALISIKLQAENIADSAEQNVRAQFKAARLLSFTPQSILHNPQLNAVYVEMLAVLSPNKAPGMSPEQINAHLSDIFRVPRSAVAGSKFSSGVSAWSSDDGGSNKELLKLKKPFGTTEARAVAVCRLAKTSAPFVVVGTTDKHNMPEFYVVDETADLDLSAPLVLGVPAVPPVANTLYLVRNPVTGTLIGAFGNPQKSSDTKIKVRENITEAELNEEPLCSELRRAVLEAHVPEPQPLLTYVKKELAAYAAAATPVDKRVILDRIHAKIAAADKDPRYGTSTVARAINKEIAAAKIPHAAGQEGQQLWQLMENTASVEGTARKSKQAIKALTGDDDCSVSTKLEYDVMRSVVAAVVNQTNPVAADLLVQAQAADGIKPETAAKADDLKISGLVYQSDQNADVKYQVTEDKQKKEIRFDLIKASQTIEKDEETCTIVMRAGKDGGTKFELSGNTAGDVVKMIRDAADIMSKAPGGKEQVPVISIGRYKKNFGDSFGHDKSLALRQARYIHTWMEACPDGHVPVLQKRLKDEGTSVAMWDTYRDLKRGAERDAAVVIKQECKDLYLQRILRGEPKQKAEFIDGMFAQTTHPDQNNHIVHAGKAYSREELKVGFMENGDAIDEPTYLAIFKAQAEKPQGLKANRDSDIKAVKDLIGGGSGSMRIVI